jgi:hypothetical protein
LTVTASENKVVSLNAAQPFRNPQFPLSIPIKVNEGETIVTADFLVYYCEAGKEALCYFKEGRLRLPVKAKSGTGSRALTARYRVR